MSPQEEQQQTTNTRRIATGSWNKLDMALEQMFSERETWLARARAAEKANDPELATVYRRQITRLAAEAEFLLSRKTEQADSKLIVFTPNRKGN